MAKNSQHKLSLNARHHEQLCDPTYTGCYGKQMCEALFLEKWADKKVCQDRCSCCQSTLVWLFTYLKT